MDLTKGKTYDLPPKNSELDSIPSSLKHLLKATKHIQKVTLEKTQNKNNQNDNGKPKHGRKLDHISALPGESMRSFAKRVKTEARKIRNAEALQQTHSLHSISDKRKEYLDRKNGKVTKNNDESDNEDTIATTINSNTVKGPSGALRVSKDGKAVHTSTTITNNNDDDEEPAFGHVIEDLFPKLAPGGSNKRRRDDTDMIDDNAVLDETGTTMIWKDNKGKIHKTQIKDDVKFGERVMEPPRFSVLPRLSSKQKQQRQRNGNDKHRSLLAAQLLQHNNNSTTGNDNKDVSSKDRSDIVRTAQIDHARNEAIRAYAELKMRRKDGQGMTGISNSKPANLLPYVSDSSIKRNNTVPTSLSTTGNNSNMGNLNSKTTDTEFTKITLDNFKTKVFDANVNRSSNAGTTTTLSSSSSSSNGNTASSSSIVSTNMRMGALRVAPRPQR